MEERIKVLIEDWLDKVIEVYKDKLGDTELGNNITKSVEFDTNGFNIKLELNDYWKYVEEGRQPGKQPPMEDMLKLTKNIIPKPYILPNGKSVIPDERQLAFLIGRKIGRDGYEGNHFLGQTIEELNGELKEGIKNIIIEEVKNIIK